MKNVDLHIHSIYSDGNLEPYQIIDVAIENKLSQIAITDHDTVEGYLKACPYAKGKNIMIVPGIEFSTYDVTDVHIIGYGVDCNAEKLNTYMNQQKKQKARELSRVLLQLKRLGIKVDLNHILIRFKVINVKNIVSYIVEEGMCCNEMEAYNLCYSYLEGKKRDYSYVLTPEDCIKLIHELNGVAILAHPMLIDKNYNVVFRKILKYKMLGLDGLECIHPKHNNKEIELCKSWAVELNLFQSGGSDFHGGLEKRLEIGNTKSYGKICIPTLL